MLMGNKNLCSISSHLLVYLVAGFLCRQFRLIDSVCFIIDGFLNAVKMK
uniref:Uncharacterized protein n=1 Tax=Anguilla anguilla TaxID=7936 RepID=A0A0E9XUL7_ANGAN